LEGEERGVAETGFFTAGDLCGGSAEERDKFSKGSGELVG
jgi:hypothetical protein